MTVPARIHKPARNAMQPGCARGTHRVPGFPDETGRAVAPLTSWTPSADMRARVWLTFPARDAAPDCAGEPGIDAVVQPPHRGRPDMRPGAQGGKSASARRATSMQLRFIPDGT